jgi:creatinine amidohydrolase
MREVHLARLTRTEAPRADEAIVLVPMGATEQHGPHLPLETDTILAERIAVGVAERAEDVLVAPPVPWGLSDAHLPLGGTLSLRAATLLELTKDIAATLLRSGFPRQMWVNGHHGNKPVLSLLVAGFQNDNVPICGLTYYDLITDVFSDIRVSAPGGSHACELETSLMLYLFPDRVRELPEQGTMTQPLTSASFTDIAKPGVLAGGQPFWTRYPDGVAGDPTAASAETGRRLFEACVQRFGDLLEEYRIATAHPGAWRTDPRESDLGNRP